jgi:hypothetical protein
MGEAWGGVVFLAVVCIGAVIMIHGCNENQEEEYKFELEKLRIERQCPEVKK